MRGQRRTWILAGAVIAVLAAGGITLAAWPSGYQPHSLPQVAPRVTSPAPKPATSPPAATIARSVPVRVLIPAVGVSAPVEPLGLCPTSNPAESCNGVQSGGLATPASHFANMAGWWSGGFTPGQEGTSVIAGHVNYAGVGNEVFANLGQLAADFARGRHDQVTTVLENGTRVDWTVTNAAQPSKNNNAAFWSSFWQATTKQSAPQLVLITCGGVLGSNGHYDDNIVIYLSLANPALAGAGGPIS